MRHKWIRLSGVLLALGLMFCCGAIFAAEDVVELESWIDHAADGFAGGTGTEDDPYLIATAEQLAYLAKTVNEGNSYEGTHFLLAEDINLGGKNWVPIGTQMERETAKDYEFPIDSTVGFAGVLNGNHKTIANAIVPEGFLLGGLFGKIHKGEIKDLLISNISIGASYFAGGLAGHMRSSTISNCRLDGDIHAAWYAGGLVGYSYITSIKECRVLKIQISETPDFIRKYYPPLSLDASIRHEIALTLHSGPLNETAAGGIAGCGFWGTFIIDSFVDATIKGFRSVDVIAGNFFEFPTKQKIDYLSGSYGFIDRK